MKRLLITVMVIVAFVGGNTFAYAAFGSAFGNFATAKTLGQGKGAFGGGIGIADATTFSGWFNYGLGRYFDGRVKVGIISPDVGDSKITFGADVRYQLWDVQDVAQRPFDLALGGFFEFVDYGMSSVLQFGGQVVGSYPITMSNGSTLSPYGRFNLRLERYSFEGYTWTNPFTNKVEKTASGSESKLRFGINAGAAWQVTPTIKLYGEFQLDGNDGLFLGAEFSVI
jgi:hypothetical protein